MQLVLGLMGRYRLGVSTLFKWFLVTEAGDFSVTEDGDFLITETEAG
jgi:ABC-type uncharacterized transport system YnjBCD ATPase subunit